MKQPFRINIEESVLADLKERLKNTRWTDAIENSGWEYGTDLNYLKDICNYWQNDFDWRKQEKYLNSFSHFKTNIDGLEIHFIYEKGKGEKNIPILLTHGWPDSFIRFLKVIPLLTKQDESGISFDVIIPSIPGYGFSNKPTKPAMNPEAIAEIFTKLMTEELGYQKFIAHGGDWGSTITEKIALHHPENVLGIHLTDIPFTHLFTVKAEDLTDAEKEYLAQGQKWQMTEGGYAMIQSSKPQTLGYGLNDSPAGLAGWIIEKFNRWSDNAGNIENAFTKDELLTNITIYWATQTINSSIRIYYETMRYPAKDTAQKVEVPTAAAMFPKDLIPAPKEFAERFFNIIQWNTLAKGGHFAAMEQPELFVKDIRNFVEKLQA